jgi:hypothetical protein
VHTSYRMNGSLAIMGALLHHLSSYWNDSW